jgi:hypothetical protein
MSFQYDFGFPTRRTLRLCEIEDILKRTRVITPVPSRSYFLNKLDEGTLEGHRTEFGWVVYEDSFKAWVKSLQQDEKAA